MNETDKKIITDFLGKVGRMCDSYDCCDCPLEKHPSCNVMNPVTWDYIFEEVERWAQEHPKQKPTLLIPDEIVNEVTFEATYVDKAGVLLSEEGKAERMQLLEELVKPALANADSVRCVKIQQFVTKGHEDI